MPRNKMKKTIRKIYDGLSERYNSRYNSEFSNFYNYETMIFIKNLSIDEGQLVLDLGCGSGRFFPYTNSEKASYVGADISTKMVEMAKRLCGVEANAIVCDAENLPFRKGIFDSIICGGMFEYIEYPGKYIHEISFILKKGGRVALNVWNALCPFMPMLVATEFKNFRRALYVFHKLETYARDFGLEPLTYRGYFFIPSSILRFFPSNLRSLLIKLEELFGIRIPFKHLATQIFSVFVRI